MLQFCNSLQSRLSVVLFCKCLNWLLDKWDSTRIQWDHWNQPQITNFAEFPRLEKFRYPRWARRALQQRSSNMAPLGFCFEDYGVLCLEPGYQKAECSGTFEQQEVVDVPSIPTRLRRCRPRLQPLYPLWRSLSKLQVSPMDQSFCLWPLESQCNRPAHWEHRGETQERGSNSKWSHKGLENPA